MTVEEMSERQSGYRKYSGEKGIEKLHGFPTCESMIDDKNEEELRRQNVVWVDGLWLGFVRWLVW